MLSDSERYKQASSVKQVAVHLMSKQVRMVQYPDQQSLEGSNNGRVEVLCLKVRLLLGLGFYEITHTLHCLPTDIMIVI